MTMYKEIQPQINAKLHHLMEQSKKILQRQNLGTLLSSDREKRLISHKIRFPCQLLRDLNCKKPI